MRRADIEGVVEQALAIGPDVEVNGEHAVGVEAARCGVDGQLADRHLHPADTPVTDAEDGLSIGRDEQVDLVGAEIGRGQRALDEIGSIHRQVDAPRPAVLVAVPLDRLTHSWRIDHREHLGQVVDQEPEEQDLVTVVEGGQEDVLCQIALLGPELPVGPRGLLVEAQDPRRHETDEPECLPLGGVEGGSLVESRGRRTPGDHAASCAKTRRRHAKSGASFLLVIREPEPAARSSRAASGWPQPCISAMRTC